MEYSIGYSIEYSIATLKCHGKSNITFCWKKKQYAIEIPKEYSIDTLVSYRISNRIFYWKKNPTEYSIGFY